MKKHFTCIVINNVAGSLPAKIFLLALLFCCKDFESRATAWTTATAGDVTILTNWTDGTSAPTSFTTPGDTWTINLAMTMTSTETWIVGTAASTIVGVTFATGGDLNNTAGSGGTATVTIYGDVNIGGGTITDGGSTTTENVSIYGDVSISAGGIVNTTGSGAIMNMNIYGNYAMAGGSVATGGSASSTVLTVYGNFSVSGASAITNSSSAATSTVHLSLPTATGTMSAYNISSTAWSKTNVFIDAGCTVQLNGNFISPQNGPSSVSATGNGLTVNGTLICPAPYAVTGTGVTAGIFKLNSGATLEVANAAGVNGAITTTGARTFNTSANYVFNGSAAQVTGTYLPVSLVTPDTVTISNSAGVTLTNTVATTGTLLFTSGILYTAANTMTTPGVAGAVVGAGATSYVDGTLIKTISGLSAVNYEVGDLDYVPMNLTFSAAGTGGSLGVIATNGLHPSVASSGILTTNIANHYWTITDYGSSGPGTVVPMATYDLSDIIGGSNATFVTQEYAGGAWLGSALATTNTSSPYTSAPTTGVPLASLPGDYIYGSECTTAAITGSPMACVGSSTILSDATASGAWSSSNTFVATVDAAGNVYGIAVGSATISYTVGCPATVVVNVGTLPITGNTSLCPGSTTTLSDATPGGVWSSDNSAVATVSGAGVVYGASNGSATIYYTFGSCTPMSATVTVTALAPVTPATATICVGSTIGLSDAAGGGAWSSGNMSIATVLGSGVVTGAGAGITTIIYTSGSCSSSATVTVSGPLTAISGTTIICVGSTVYLTDATGGGVWSSDNTPVATVSTAGSVLGVSAGSANISYTVGVCAVGIAVTVNGPISAITGNTTVCAGSTTNLSDGTTGGVWSSNSTSIAIVSTIGVVTGVAAGNTAISYTVGGCSVGIAISVGGTLSAITGSPTTFCEGSATSLSDVAGGGVWSSGNTSVATVAGGVVHGITAGSASIIYTDGGCSVNTTITVEAPNGGAITGEDSVCPGHTITLSDVVTGGVWSSSSTAHATIDPGTGVVSGVSSGATTITYIVTNSCGTYTVTDVVHVRTAAQCATGVPDVTGPAPEGLFIFPNPNSGTFTMYLSSDSYEDAHVVIVNILGAQIKELMTTTNTKVDIDLDHVATGIYILSASTAHGKYIKKVAVQ